MYCDVNNNGKASDDFQQYSCCDLRGFGFWQCQQVFGVAHEFHQKRASQISKSITISLVECGAIESRQGFVHFRIFGCFVYHVKKQHPRFWLEIVQFVGGSIND